MIKVLSLFDGMSGLQIALDKLGIEYKYYASEIDEYAIAVTQYNYPDTIQLGDITEIRFEGGILYSKDNQYNVGHFDLIAGGSPCQGFSFAGQGLNFDDPRSKLYFEFERLVREVNPDYFLLENVNMKAEYKEIISSRLGVSYIRINSERVSAGLRDRLYWTNIPEVHKPKNLGIDLEDILETGVVDRRNSYCVDANYYKGGNLRRYFEYRGRQLVFEFSSKSGFKDDPIPLDKAIPLLASDYKSGSKINRNQRQNAVTEMVENGDIYYRKLTPLECERIQTVPDQYTSKGMFGEEVKDISDTQRYKMLGNGFTVDMIKHILSFAFQETQ